MANTINERGKEKALVRIQKLLALSTSPNEHEAQEALLMAQKLMAKYGMSIEQTKEEEIEYLQLSVDTDNSQFRIPLANVISRNFRCEVYLRGGAITFYGHTEDCKICKSVYEFAYKEIHRLGNRAYNRAKKDGFETKGFYTNYRNAFIYALKTAFEKQCTALMIVTPKDVKDTFEEMVSGYEVKTTHSRNMGVNAYARNCGYKDGNKFAENVTA